MIGMGTNIQQTARACYFAVVLLVVGMAAVVWWFWPAV